MNSGLSLLGSSLMLGSSQPQRPHPQLSQVAGGACFWGKQNRYQAAFLSSFGARLGKRPPLSPTNHERSGQEVHNALKLRFGASVQHRAGLSQRGTRRAAL